MLLPYKMFSRCNVDIFFQIVYWYEFGKAYMGSLSESSSDYPSVNWKRAQPAPLSINNKNSAGYRQPLGSNTQAHGRTDWAAKYVHLTT